jgi:hypothetical protein
MDLSAIAGGSFNVWIGITGSARRASPIAQQAKQSGLFLFIGSNHVQ